MARRLVSTMVRMKGGPTLGGSPTRVYVYDDEALTVPSTLYQRATGAGTQPNPITPNAGKHTTLRTATLVGSTVLNVVSIAGFAVGDLAPIFNGTVTTFRVITALNAVGPTMTVDQAVGTAFATATTVINRPSMRGHVWFWVDDVRDYFIQPYDVGAAENMPPLQIPTQVPTTTVAVQEEGAAAGTRGAINYIGRSVTAADDAANARVNVTIGIGGTEAAPSPEVLTDTDTGLWGEGGDIISIVTGGKRAARFIGGPTSVDYLEIASNSIGLPNINARGTSANVWIGIYSKSATSVISLGSDSGATTTAQFVGAASAVNYVTVTNAATGNPTTIAAAGSDANISLNLVPKGTGTLQYKGVEVARFTLAAEQATTSGTSIDFTGIPAGTKRITVMFVGVSTNLTSLVMVQLGDSGGVETTGYLGSVSGGAGVVFSSGFLLENTGIATSTRHGAMTLTLEDSTDNTWACMFAVGRSDTSTASSGGGTKALSATLDRIRLTTVGGTDTFDAGAMSISYE